MAETISQQYPGALTKDEITAQDVRARFVTVKDYEKAGGAVRQDLFSEGDKGVYIEDAVLCLAAASGSCAATYA
jgi:ParB family chromosome partitioning protein